MNIQFFHGLLSLYEEVIMHIDFTFKNFEPSDHLKKYARRRFEKIGRFLGKGAVLSLQVVLIVDKFRHRAEVSLAGEGLNVNASEQSDDMYATIDLIADKLESQVRRAANRSHHNRQTTRGMDIDVYTYELEEEDGVRVVSGKENFSRKPLYVDEAIMQFQKSGNEVLVFINAEVDRINVIYQKKNGDLGIIDPIL